MKSLGRRASTRCVQLLGNILKIAFYLDIWLRPGKRYTIPANAAPLARSTSPKRIPRIVWQTNYTNKVTLSVYVNYRFNRWMAPTYEFRFCGDEDCDRFIRENFSAEIYDCYSRLQIGAAKADLWRVLVLLVYGGVYMDIDAALSWSPEAFLNPDQTELFVRPPEGMLTNYFLASVPGNAVFKAIADKIVANIGADSLASVYDMTGPTVVDAIAGAVPVYVERYNLVCRQGQFTKKSFQYPNNRKDHWSIAQQHTRIVRKHVVVSSSDAVAEPAVTAISS
ncbi:glycosyltransferase family 32 protein [Bradyrhizobium lablabi]|uniref:glycosyltransferase family 32 protein n=1 Tax=Bradyrhizobium lablabi TaxID=722472 RepID=UPI001BA95AE9|nr:glycosyltransferase [Bradyrhizobium lablabi]MBR0693260.1 mannosyltransferase [Bradyrhizobium lablabi]